MNKIARQILQLKNELERQKAEQAQLFAETRNLTRETQQENEWLHAQRQESKVVAPPPQPPTAPASQSSTRNTSDSRVPSDEDLYKIAADPEKFGVFFAEIDDWYVRDRTAQAPQPPTESKWFGEGKVPDIESMLDSRNFAEMLKELEEL